MKLNLKYIVIAVIILYLLKKPVINVVNYAKLSELNKEVRKIAEQFIKEVETKTGYTVIITSVYRSFAKQAELNKANSANAKAGFSYHNYGLAFDINLQKGTQLIKKSSPKLTWLQTGIIQIADKYNLQWGGDFSNYYDPVHFDFRAEFPDINKLYAKAQIEANKKGIAVNNIEGNKINLA